MGFRVLVITPWFPNVPGEQSGNFILHSVEALVRAGNEVTVLVTRPWTPRVFGLLHSDWQRRPLRIDKFDPQLRLQVKNYLSIPRNYFQECAGPLYLLGTGSKIRELVRANGIEVIHAHTEQAGYAAIPVAREFGIPALVSLHGINTAPRLLNSARKRATLRGVLDRAARLIIVGEPLRGYFSELAGRENHFRVVPNGFDFAGMAIVGARPKPGTRTRIISVSNLHEGKGIDLNLQALSLLNKEGVRDWTYTIVGGGREREALTAMVSDLGLERQVTFTGALPHDRALLALGEADIFLLPSYREAFGIAYLEAMAAGLLAIGVEGEGPQAFIRHGETGYLVPPRDVESISRLLRAILEDGATAERVAVAGQKHVLANFTWANHAEKLMSIYGEVVGVSLSNSDQ